MSLWRLKYAVSELSPARLRAHSQTLEQPSRFYAGLLLKMIPGPWKRPLTLRLKQGGTIRINHFMSLYIYEEIFVDRCYDLRLGDMQPCIIDVGANMGLFALRMRQLFPQARIACFEPNAENFKLLQDTLRENNLEGVTAIRKGVASAPGAARLYLHPGNSGGHSILPELASGSFAEIELTDLAGALRESGFERCDLLKLDCEGAEKGILESLEPKLTGIFPNIVFEATPRAYDVNSLVGHLQRLGYIVQFKNGLHHAEIPSSTRVKRQEPMDRIYAA